MNLSTRVTLNDVYISQSIELDMILIEHGISGFFTVFYLYYQSGNDHTDPRPLKTIGRSFLSPLAAAASAAMHYHATIHNHEVVDVHEKALDKYEQPIEIYE